MDGNFTQQLSYNCSNYKKSLARIIDKYAKLQYHDGGIEVDFGNTKISTLERYMERSEAEMGKLESKTLAELRSEAVKGRESTRISQLDLTLQNGGADETCVSNAFNISHVSSVSTSNTLVEEDGDVSAAGIQESRSDMTQLTASTLDESQRSFSEVELQPEDQDEELEMTLSRHGSLVDIYPSMISRIGNAWRRQHVSDAADSVLRRYRKWRQSNRSLNADNMFTVNLKRKKQKIENTETKETSGSPVKRHFMGTDRNSHPHFQMINNQQNRQTHQQSPGRARCLLRSQHPMSGLVMDCSDPPQTVKPSEIRLNETFTVSEPSPPEEIQQDEQTSFYSASPSRSYHPTPKGPLDTSLRTKRLLNAAQSPGTGRCSMYTSQTPAVRERSDCYSSPVKLSPAKARIMSSIGRSPQHLSRSPQPCSVERLSRGQMRPRSLSTSLSSPQRKIPLTQRIFYPENSHHSLQSALPSPHSERAESRPQPRRHLSFDSSTPSIFASYSPQQLDEDFIKLYHKFVCQNKSAFFKGPPCRFCARNSEATRSNATSSLAALALSPHRSVLRKRHRELSLENHPQSKRFRDEYFATSQGIKHRGTEMLRRHRSPSESEQKHDGYPTTRVNAACFRRFSSQQRPAEVYQEACMRRSRHGSAAECSGHGSSPLRRVVDSTSPRKWW